MDFFTRNGYPADTQARCWNFARDRYPAATFHEATSQGYCSYTLLLNQEDQEDVIVQFRPQNHSIDPEVAALAREVYGNLAPRITTLAPVTLSDSPCGHQPLPLIAFLISRIPGRPLSEVALLPGHRESLLTAFARMTHTSWTSSLCPSGEDIIPKRRIGASLGSRLTQLSTCLPDRFRPVAAQILASLPKIESLPWVFTHGDLVPSNIMVTIPGDSTSMTITSDTTTPNLATANITTTPDATTTTTSDSSSSNSTAIINTASKTALILTGLLDWAEAEYLPLGMSLYTLEELLGSTTTTTTRSSTLPSHKYPPPNSIFSYSPSASTLRRTFWTHLGRLIPDLVSDREFRRRVELAGVAGILLWHGFAFDDGRLDRVVQEGRDDEEVQRLDVMLLGRGMITGQGGIMPKV